MESVSITQSTVLSHPLMALFDFISEAGLIREHHADKLAYSGEMAVSLLVRVCCNMLVLRRTCLSFGVLLSYRRLVNEIGKEAA
jgi:hypothetical protein